MTLLGQILKVRKLRSLRSDTRGVALLEFGLTLPIFIGLMGAGLEMANLMMANMKVQRLATMTADIVAQRGASADQISELQIYDVLSSLDVAARPLDVRERGRVIITAVVGEDTNGDNAADTNRIKWQRFDGAFAASVPVLGCWQTSTVGTLSNDRHLNLSETIFHTQVSYRYEPIFSQALVRFFHIPEVITRTSAFRGRGSIFRPVLSVEGFPPKQNCSTANGL